MGQSHTSRSDKVEWARKTVTENSWGILSTISTIAGLEGTPFGNPNSYAEIDGQPYFYVSGLDQSMQDVSKTASVSLSISDAQMIKNPACGTIPKAGDPESPICTRLTMSGSFVNISGTTEADEAWGALQEAHPAMSSWPADHNWFIGKLDISHLWLINIFGGASNITPEEYFADEDKK